MPSLNLNIDYFNHRKTKRLIRLLGKGSEVLPLKLWVYAARYFADDGRLTGISAQEIEDECQWWGRPGEMVKVMLLEEVKFLVLENETLCVYAWGEHEGHISAFNERAKAGAQKRWENYRNQRAPSNATSNATSIAPSNAPTNPTMPTKPTVPAQGVGLRLSGSEERAAAKEADYIARAAAKLPRKAGGS